jgi:hypothetical protein
MRLIKVLFLRTISEIKLKRTDTTLDLSQKAYNTLLAIIITTRRLRVQVKLTKRAKGKKKRTGRCGGGGGYLYSGSWS